MILEFRTQEGTHKFELRGKAAEIAYSHLEKDPEVEKKVLRKKFKDGKGKDFTCFTVQKTQGYKMIQNMLEFIIQPGEYVKILP